MSFFRNIFQRPHAERTVAEPPAAEDKAHVTHKTEFAEPIDTVAPTPAVILAETTTTKDAKPKTISRPHPRAHRVKSRLLSQGQLDAVLDEFEYVKGGANASISRPVGWLVIIEGPGTGGWFTLDTGVSRIGHGEDQDIRLDFGDGTISQSNHASIAYEQGDHRFRLGSGDCQNELLVNGEVIQGTINLVHGDRITIGETTLRLAAFCDDRFSWAPIIDKGDQNVLSA